MIAVGDAEADVDRGVVAPRVRVAHSVAATDVAFDQFVARRMRPGRLGSGSAVQRSRNDSRAGLALYPRGPRPHSPGMNSVGSSATIPASAARSTSSSRVVAPSFR